MTYGDEVRTMIYTERTARADSRQKRNRDRATAEKLLGMPRGAAGREPARDRYTTSELMLMREVNGVGRPPKGKFQ